MTGRFVSSERKGPRRWLGALALFAGSAGCIDEHPRADPPETDGAFRDASTRDRGPADAGFDASLLDAAPLDAEPPDAEPPDAEPPDAEPPDAEPLDAAPPDAGDAACTLPVLPPVDCSPDQLGAFEPVPPDLLEPVAFIDGAEAGQVALPDACTIEHAARYDIADEAGFQAAVTCPPGVTRTASTVDWARSRLLLIGAQPGSRFNWAVIAEGTLRVGLETEPDCSGAPMPGHMLGFLVPADAPPLGEPFDCMQPLGPQGCCSCAVICDPTPRIGECVCPP